MSVINTNPSKYNSENNTEWKYLSKNIRYCFEFWECISGTKIMVRFEKYTRWSILGFNFRKKWRFLRTKFNKDMQKHSDDFCS